MAISTLTYYQISRIEAEFQPCESDPTYSYLQLRIYSHGATQPDKVAFFPSTAEAADHLHNICGFHNAVDGGFSDH